MKNVKNSLFAVIVILSLVGCGGGGESDSSKQVPIEIKSAGVFDLYGDGVGVKESAKVVFNANGVKGSPARTYQVNAVSANGCAGESSFSKSPFTISGEKKYEFGFSIPFKSCITDKVTIDYTISFDGGTNKFPYTTYLWNPSYIDTNVYKESGTDPLYKYQWHLKNKGQSKGVAVPATAGEDINIEDVWNTQKITGKGVTIAVVDSGIDMFHPDLKENINMELSHNYRSGNLVGGGSVNNPTPLRYDRITKDPETGGEVTGGYIESPHGTAVAGIIAAKGWNGIGTRGVAPNATLASFNSLEVFKGEARKLFDEKKIPYLFTDDGLTLYRLVDSLDVRNKPNQIDIYNNSWGDNNISLQYDDYGSQKFDDTLKYGVIHGREGKGAIYVKSAGNGGSGDWSNFEQMQTNGYFIVVGSSGANGNASSYSTRGPNVLLNAPGGAAYSKLVRPELHAIVTTDLAGKIRGYDANIPYLSDTSHFRVQGNENYDYTNLMNGTSAAAPIVSGVVALMLEANPSLTWRDVRYILAKSAFRNDANDSSWVKNGAGHWYSTTYGFGRVDAAQAVTMSKNFVSLGGFHKMKSIKSSSYTTSTTSSSAKATIKINEDINIEHVAIRLTLDLNSSTTQYVTQTFNGSGDSTTSAIALTKGKNIFNVSSVFDSNTSIKGTTDVKMIEDKLTATTYTDIATLTTDKPDAVKKVIDIGKKGNYKLKIDSNATSWSIEVQSPIANTLARNVNITLTSPSGTVSTLVSAPNALSENDTYTNTRLSSIQFLDEKSSGEWKVEVKDTNGGVLSLTGLNIEITGR